MPEPHTARRNRNADAGENLQAVRKFSTPVPLVTTPQEQEAQHPTVTMDHVEKSYEYGKAPVHLAYP